LPGAGAPDRQHSALCRLCVTDAYIAENHDAGDVVAQSGGVRKVRWIRAGSGKSGGVRVIYFTRTEAGEVVLLTMYAKSKLATLKAATLKELRNAVEKSLQAND
jgi:hypothetical protein